jgi:peroxiredoxin
MTEKQIASTETKKPAKGRLFTFVVGLWIGVLIAAVVLGVLAFTGVISFNQSIDTTGIQIDPSQFSGLGQPAMDFQLQDLEGKAIRLSAFKGKVVVLNFWATWCGPCVREMPMFQQYTDQFPNDLVVLGINMQEEQDDVKSFLANLNINYEILLDSAGEVGKLYQVFALPDTLFINREGLVKFHHFGVMTEEQFAGYLDQMELSK